MTLAHNKTAATLVSLVQQWVPLRGAQEKNQRARAKKLADKIQLIGQIAYDLGGIEAMRDLDYVAESLVGNDRSVGYWLMYLWDGVGEWAA